MDRQNAIAVIGLALRFPGADSKEEFWTNLREARDAVVTLSDEELLARGASPADLAKPNYVRRVSRLRDPELFDPGFFALTSREAQVADPQLRVLLEVCHQAIEDSGHVLSGTRTGVYVGAADNEFWLSKLIYHHPQALGASLANRTYIKNDYVATQLSHKLNLTGPSVSVSTACSTSLVAVHEAVTHLLFYDCDYAIAGGCEIDQGLGYLYTEGETVSPDGCCRAFGANANGTLFGSGCGAVVLRRYEDAVRDRDHIYALILSTRINNDGRRKAGFVAPSAAGQSEVIYEAIATAGVSAEDITFVEAHGTGTLVGDPIEMQALTQTYRRFTARKSFCAVGSVKTNIGHLSVAAGVAGLIKATLALQHREIPATLHFDAPNPAIDFANSPFYVNTALVGWDTGDAPRVAAVSAFGVGGTNAHAILTEAPARELDGDARRWHLIPVSARSPEALAQARTNLETFLSRAPVARADAAYTSQVGRSEHAFRSALVCGDASGPPHDSRWVDGGKADGDVQVAFMFPGQGAQYVGMSAGLYADEPLFRQTVDQCSRLLEDDLGLDLRHVLYPPPDRRDEAESLLGQTRYTQPAVFVTSYATATLLRAWGISPRALVGHSIGEYVAACLAGVFTLPDCLKVISARGRLMQSAPKGAMLAVSASSEVVRRLLPPAIDVAAINGANQCVVSGTEEDVDGLLARLNGKGIRAQRVPTSHAFHSRMMDEILAPFVAVFDGLTLQPPAIDVVSNVTGRSITAAEATDPVYWATHLRSAVRFADGLETVATLGATVFVEVGPGTTLATLARQADRTAIATIRHPKTLHDDSRFLAESLGELCVRGVRIDWDAYQTGRPRNRVPLPTYPFQRTRFGPPAQSSGNGHGKITRRAVHPLLGQRWSSSSSVRTFENFVSAEHPPYLEDHRLIDSAIFPGAAYAEMALAAARRQFGERPVRIERILFERLLRLEPDESRPMQTVAYDRDDRTTAFEITSLARGRTSDPEGTWQLHAKGSYRLLDGAAAERVDLDRLRRRIATPNAMAFYADSAVKYGPRFRALTAAWADGDEVLGRVALPASEIASAAEYWCHPILLDACFQAIGALASHGQTSAMAVPVGLVDWDVYAPRMPFAFWVHAALNQADADTASRGGVLSGVTITLLDDSGGTLARIDRYERRELSPELIDDQHLLDDLMYEIAWTDQEAPRGPVVERTSRATVILTDHIDWARQFATELSASGDDRVSVVDYRADRDLTASLSQALAGGSSRHVELLMLRVSDQEMAVDELCDVLLRSVQFLVERAAEHTAHVTIATRGSQSVLGGRIAGAAPASGGALWGMGAAIVREHPDLKCLRVDLDPDEAPSIGMLIAELSGGRDEHLVAFRGRTRYVARLRPLPHRGADANESSPFAVRVGELGSFDALARRPIAAATVGPNDVEVELHAAGLNFKETLIVLGMLDVGHAVASDIPLGFEGAGRVSRVGSAVTTVAVGDPVLVWANGCLASHIRVGAGHIVKMPSSLTFEQAAGLPTVCMTAYYALHVLGKMAAGDRVLIHAAAGGVGQAAVRLARAAGAEIYATASRDKWAFLAEQGITHLFDSRTTDFADSLMAATAGEGVTLVLNALTGDFIEKSFDVLAQGGRFVEIGKLNIWSAERARAFRPDVEYHAFELGVGAAGGERLLERLLTPVLQRIESGDFGPLPLRVFPLDEVVPAFRWLAAGRNIGKGVIRIRDVRTAPGRVVGIREDGQYLVTGGLGALGLRVAEWLVKKGARDIALVGRRAPSAAVEKTLEGLRARGAAIRVHRLDIADRAELGAFVADLPRLAGVFHCAGVLDDGVMLRQTRPRFQSVLRPKVLGLTNLHELTRAQPLDHFVCYSSTSAMLDGGGQSSYAAANAYLEAFMVYRRSLALPGLAIAWGAWAGGGMAADLEARKPGSSSDFIEPYEGIAALEELVLGGRVHAVVARMHARLARDQPSMPLFRELTAADRHAVPRESRRFDEILRSHGGDISAALAGFLKIEVCKILGVAPDQFGNDDDFIESGIDSLMLAELRNNVQKGLGKSVPASVFFARPNISALARYIVETHFAPETPHGDAAVSTTASTIVPLRAAAAGMPYLFCVPGIGDNIFDFKHLADAVSDRSVCVFQGHDESAGRMEPDEITFLARHHVEAMRRLQPSGPYHLMGYSFGGSVAVEMVHQLLVANDIVGSLTLLDSVPFFRLHGDARFQRAAYLLLFDMLSESIGGDAETSGWLHDLFVRAADSPDPLRRLRDLSADADVAQTPQRTAIRQLIEIFSRRLTIEYQPPPRLGDIEIHHLRASRGLGVAAQGLERQLSVPDGHHGQPSRWEDLIENRTIVTVVDCSHFALLKPPNVAAVVTVLNAADEVSAVGWRQK
jgi:myxalamid-type polyketide synthase MxaB